VFKAAVKSTHLIVLHENQKRENVEIKRNLYTNPHLKDRIDIEFTAC